MIRFLVVGIVLCCTLAAEASPLPCNQQNAAASYRAADGRQLEACFDLKQQKVTLRLPDGVQVVLPSAMSASGARYNKGDQTFWEHQGVGRYLVGDRLLFEGRIVPPEAYNSGVTADILTQTMVTANGQKISYPATDKAEVTAMLVELAPGMKTGWHKHPVPVYAYLLSGELMVELEGGKNIHYKTGDAIIEVVNTLHNGVNSGTVPARLVVFYTGIQGQPNVIGR